jgi:hypothetical protein
MSLNSMFNRCLQKSVIFDKTQITENTLKSGKLLMLLLAGLIAGLTRPHNLLLNTD